MSRMNQAPKATLSALALVCGAAFALGACPGDLPPGLMQKDAKAQPRDKGPWSTPDQQTWKPSDAGPPPADQAAPQPDQAAPKPDTKPPPTPDTGPPPPQTGGPCPCAAGLECIAGICRGTCPVPTDACRVQSTCPAQHGCLQTNKPGVWVCMPAAGPGGVCSASVYCPTGHVCGAVGSAINQCLPTCGNPGGSCGAGNAGQCVHAGNGCNICSTP